MNNKRKMKKKKKQEKKKERFQINNLRINVKTVEE
jgi:hypothetical protein